MWVGLSNPRASRLFSKTFTPTLYFWDSLYMQDSIPTIESWTSTPNESNELVIIDIWWQHWFNCHNNRKFCIFLCDLCAYCQTNPENAQGWCDWSPHLISCSHLQIPCTATKRLSMHLVIWTFKLLGTKLLLLEMM